jgi:hypothetical protein
MPLLVICDNPDCGEIFDAPDSADGKSVRCPACGNVQRVVGEGKDSDDATPPRAQAMAIELREDIEPAQPSPDWPSQNPTPKRPKPSPQPTKPPTKGVGQQAPPSQPQRRPSPTVDRANRPMPASSGTAELELESDNAVSAPAQPQTPEAMLDALDSGDGDMGDGLEQFGPDLEGILDQIDLPNAANESNLVSQQTAFRSLLTALGFAALGGLVSVLIFGLSFASLYLGIFAGWAAGLVGAVAMTIGLSDIDNDEKRTMLGDSFGAWRYPLNRIGAMIGVSLGMAVLATLLDALQALALQHMPQAYTPSLVALGVLGWLLSGYAFRWMLDAAENTRHRRPRPPKPPSIVAPETFLAILVLPLVVLLYILPVVTLPLLPIALVLASENRYKAALNPMAVSRVAKHQPTGVMVLHLALLVWLAAGGLGMALLTAIRQAVLARVDIAVTTGLVARIVATGITTLLLAAVVQALALAGGHCVGFFSLYYRTRAAR